MFRFGEIFFHGMDIKCDIITNKLTINDIIKDEKNIKNFICPISFNKSKNVSKLLCNHMFDKNMIIQWFLIQETRNQQYSCPICRTIFN